MTRGALVTAGSNAYLIITMGATGAVPIQTEVWPGRPEDLVRGAPDGQADIMKRPPGYVMDIGILYRGALHVSIVAKGRPWKTTGS